MLGLTICALGALDVMLTRRGLALGLITEANPVLAALFARSPETATVAAILIPVAAVLLICVLDHLKGRLTPWPRRSLYALLAVRLAVTALHIRWLALALSGQFTLLGY